MKKFRLFATNPASHSYQHAHHLALSYVNFVDKQHTEIATLKGDFYLFYFETDQFNNIWSPTACSLAHMLPTKSWTGSFFGTILLECEEREREKEKTEIRQRWEHHCSVPLPWHQIRATHKYHESHETPCTVYIFSCPFLASSQKKQGIRPLMTNHR